MCGKKRHRRVHLLPSSCRQILAAMYMQLILSIWTSSRNTSIVEERKCRAGQRILHGVVSRCQPSRFLVFTSGWNDSQHPSRGSCQRLHRSSWQRQHELALSPHKRIVLHSLSLCDPALHEWFLQSNRIELALSRLHRPLLYSLSARE